jgi:hypothetical protein
MQYYSAIKKELGHLQEMDGTVDYHVEWDKPSSVSQISHVFAHMWTLDLKWWWGWW